MSKPVDLDDYRILKAVKEQAGLTDENSNIVEALEEARERSVMYALIEIRQEQHLEQEYGIAPQECHNAVCVDNTREGSLCKRESKPVGCLFRMVSAPPNSLSYDEYMPSHGEALDCLEKHSLLKGARERYKKCNSTYDRAQSSDERDNQEVKGITMGQLEMVAKAVVTEMGRAGLRPEEDEAGIFARNLIIETEKAMGIYPNITLLGSE